MITLRHALTAVAVVGALLPAVPVHAATDSTDAADTVRAVATDAAELMAEEQQLVELADPDLPSSAVDRVEVRARLRTVDRQGSDALLQLERLGVDITEAMRATLQRLPSGSDVTPEQLQQSTPPGVVYDAAIVDLMRIAANPEAVTTTTSTSSDPATGLLAVAALALVALGGAALANTLRNKPAADELAAMAWSDGLTGLANRRRLDRDLASSAAARGVTGVIMVDADHFKSVNDTFGHQVGDQMLRRLGMMLTDHVRLDDVVYRYGGEEFCILLPGASAEDASLVAERIVTGARDIALPDDSHLTVSVGVSSSTDGTVADAIEFADRALFAAKDRGRDRVVIADHRSLEPA